MIRERSIAGQNAARQRGRMPGRERAMEPDLEASMVAEYLAGGITYASLSFKYDVSLSVVKRAVYRVTKPAEYQLRAKV